MLIRYKTYIFILTFAQTRKLKDGITLEEAKAQVRELWEDDWLGLDYRLEDNDGNIILKLEHDD